MAAKVTFNPTTKIITVTQAPVGGIVSVDVKIDLYSDGKEDWKSDANLTKFRFPIRAVGGDPLPGNKFLGSTFFLLYGWKIRPYEASHTMNVNGNLYTEDGSSPYVSTIGTFNIAIVSSVSSLVDSTSKQTEFETLKYQIESLRETHQGFGQSFYLDPINGSDTNNGLEVATPKKTFASAQSLAAQGRNDVIYLLSPDTGTTTIDERWVITVSDLSIRGPGRGILLKPQLAGGSVPTISIEANGASLSGFIVEAATADATTANAIDVWGRFSKIENMWINRAKNGVRYCAGDYHFLGKNDIELHNQSGVLVDDVRFGTAFAGNGAPREITITDFPNIYLNTGDGIKLVADTVNYGVNLSTRLVRIKEADIEHNSGYGLNIGAGVYRTTTSHLNIMQGNTLGKINDLGTATYSYERDVTSKILTTGKFVALK